jgi:hypothetical protein
MFCPEFVIQKNNKEVFSFPKALDKKEYIWKKASMKYPKVNWLYTNVSRAAFVVSLANNSQAR